MSWGDVGDSFSDFGSSVSDSFSDFGSSVSDSFSDLGSDLADNFGIGSTMGDDIGSGNFGDVTSIDYSGGDGEGYAPHGNTDSGKEVSNAPLGIDDIQAGYAGMLRSDYDYWRNNFKPFEELYRSNLNDPERRAMLDQEALGFVDRASDNAYGKSVSELNFQDRKYGISLDADEKASRDRRLLLAKRSNRDKNRTNMRQYLNERNNQILSGGIG